MSKIKMMPFGFSLFDVSVTPWTTPALCRCNDPSTLLMLGKKKGANAPFH